jgi:catechol 2,3-dioxygenase-like lactoylglutathione lyase family enzyme
MTLMDHVGIPVSDYARSKAFYDRALAPLGVAVIMEFGPSAGYGRGRKPDFWISGDGGERALRPSHFAFTAQSRDEVDAFYRAALEAGGKDNGPPGIRPQYHPGYYGAFVLDPDGHNVEAVHHGAG